MLEYKNDLEGLKYKFFVRKKHALQVFVGVNSAIRAI